MKGFFLSLVALYLCFVNVAVADFSDGFVAHWTLDEGEGSVAHDSVGTNDGTIHGATWTTNAIVGGALSFDGVDDYVVATQPSLASLTTQMSVQVWVNFRTLKTAWFPRRNTILEEREFSGGNSGAMTKGFYLCYDGYDYGDNTGAWSLDIATDGVAKGFSSLFKIELNEWYCIAVTYNGSELILYVNGVLENSWVLSGSLNPATNPLLIAKAYHYLDSCSDGIIDDVRVYSRALSADEVQELYNSANAPLFSVDGFEAPMANGPVQVKKNRVLPLKIRLFDPDSVAITNSDLGSPPVIQIFYESAMPGSEPIDVTDQALPAGAGTDGNQFEFTVDQKWQYNLKTSLCTATGTYTIYVESGNSSEYTIDHSSYDPGQFVIK